MEVTIAFLIGLMFGGCLGVFAMTLMNVADYNDEDDDDFPYVC